MVAVVVALEDADTVIHTRLVLLAHVHNVVFVCIVFAANLCVIVLRFWQAPLEHKSTCDDDDDDDEISRQ